MPPVAALAKSPMSLPAVKAPWRPGDHNTAHGITEIGAMQRRGHLLIHRKCQRILFFRAIEPDGAHRALIGHKDMLGHLFFPIVCVR